jgi:two-component system sensor histidine kinase and response regulator WspE
VLLVEDDPLTVFNTERSLRTSQDVHAVTVAVDGRDALDRLRSGVFDGDRVVVVTDLDMPRMTGLQLVTAMRGEPAMRRLPVVIVTQSSAETDRHAARTLEVAGYIVKSAGSRHLDQMLAWLHGYARQRGATATDQP